jgi:hypothetical protein
MNRKDLLAKGAQLAPIGLLAACTRSSSPSLAVLPATDGRSLVAPDDFTEQLKSIAPGERPPHLPHDGPFYHVHGDLWIEVIPSRWTKGNGLAIAWKGKNPYRWGHSRMRYAGSMSMKGGTADFRRYLKMGYDYEGFSAEETFYNDLEHRKKWWEHHIIKVWDKFYLAISKDHLTGTLYDETMNELFTVQRKPGGQWSGKWLVRIRGVDHVFEQLYDIGGEGSGNMPDGWGSAQCNEAISNLLGFGSVTLLAIVGALVLSGAALIIAVIAILLAAGATGFQARTAVQECTQ